MSPPAFFTSPFRIVAIVILAFASSAHAALVAHYQMDEPQPLRDSVTAKVMTDPADEKSPTFLPTGGVNGSGAFQFQSESSEYLSFNHIHGAYLFLGANHSDWTFSFWIKTTDDGTHLANYPGTPQVPILGNITGGVGFGIGIDGGIATYARYSGTWQIAQGTINVADGKGHYVTFVAHGSATLDIYIDGTIDVQGLSIPPEGFSQLGNDVGRSYLTATTQHHGDFIIDDIRLWNTALTISQFKAELNLPEPASASALAVAVVAGSLRRRR